MIKKLIVAVCLLLSFVSLAQEGTSSPYSFYGAGEYKFRGTAETRAMGNLTVLPDSIHMNLQNPAFYPYLKLTSFSLGASYGSTKMKTNTEQEKATRTTLDYIAVGIPMGKFGAGFGLMPTNVVGYKIKSRPTQEVPQVVKYTGTGGLNKAFLGVGYEIAKNFSIGAEFGYYFGRIETSSLTEIADVQYGTRELNDSKASGPGLIAGISYTSKVGKDLQFAASATYSPSTTMTFSNERSIATVAFLSNGVSVVDEVELDVPDTEIKLPSRFSFGAGIGEARKWMAGAEVTLLQSKNTENLFADIDNAEFKNGARYSLGGYFIPNFASFSEYWKRITYRAGMRYEETGLVLNNKTITDAAVSVGFGLPLGGTFSNINLGFDYGKRGTRDAALIEENYFTFIVGLSFNDRWFVKRKFD
jgi:long-subunit fatty acid transport protein